MIDFGVTKTEKLQEVLQMVLLRLALVLYTVE